MSALTRAWRFLDGKKTILGYPITQILTDHNVVSAWTDEVHAVTQALVTGNPAVLVQPTLVAVGQTLLAIGVAHKVYKDITSS